MMHYVTDSHSLIWYLTEDNRLGKNASSIFTKADKGEEVIIVPTIVLAEIIYICEKKKVDIEIKQIISKIKDSLNYIIYNLNIEILEEVITLKEISEMHDRILVTTTKLLDAVLITKDREIMKSKIVRTVW